MNIQRNNNKTWGIDRRISLTNLGTLLAIIIAGVTFYDQVGNNQIKTDTHFQQVDEERKADVAARLDAQKTQTQMLIQLTTITERENYLADTVKDLSDSIKIKG